MVLGSCLPFQKRFLHYQNHKKMKNSNPIQAENRLLKNPFFGTHHNALRREAQHYLAAKFPKIAPEDRSDIVSDVFLELWLKSESLTLTCPPNCFLKLICKRRAIDFQRKKMPVSLDNQWMDGPVSINAEDALNFAYLFDNQIVEAVKMLPERRRLLIQAQYLAVSMTGWSTAERQDLCNKPRCSDKDFATAWGVKEGSIRQERRRGINQLRDMLA